ncbi:MAG: hypothetical protein ACYC7A_20565 [Thermoanaerobaculia bacterium]
MTLVVEVAASCPAVVAAAEGVDRSPRHPGSNTSAKSNVAAFIAAVAHRPAPNITDRAP